MDFSFKYMLLQRLTAIEGKLDQLLQASQDETRRDEMSQADIDALKTKVDANRDVTQSAVDLINGLAAQIRELADDPAQLQALASQLEAQSADLAAAVSANTPAQP